MISNVVEISNLIALKAPVSIPRDSNRLSGMSWIHRRFPLTQGVQKIFKIKYKNNWQIKKKMSYLKIKSALVLPHG